MKLPREIHRPRSWQRFILFVLIVGRLVLIAIPGVAGEKGTDLYRACGLNCLAVVAGMRGVDVTLNSLEAVLKPRPNGDSSLMDIERAARSIGLDPVSTRLDLDRLASAPMPTIVQLKSRSTRTSANHYVVVVGLYLKGVVVVDPPLAATYQPYEQFSRDWTGIAVSFPSNASERQLFVDRLRTTPQWLSFLPYLIGLGSIVVLGYHLRLSGRRQSLLLLSGPTDVQAT